MAVCQLHQEQQEHWLICLSKHCELEEKECCSGCFLTKHLHNDQIQFKMKKDIVQAIEQYAQLAQDRIKLEDQLEMAYASRMQKIILLLDREKDAIREQMQEQLGLEKSKRIIKLKEGSYQDAQLIYELTQQEKEYMPEQQRKKLKGAYTKIQEQINKWRESPYQKSSIDRNPVSKRHAENIENIEVFEDRPRKQNKMTEDRREMKSSRDVRRQEENRPRPESANMVPSKKNQVSNGQNSEMRRVKNFEQAQDYVNNILSQPTKPKQLRLFIEGDTTTVNIKNFSSFVKILGGLEIEVLELRICEDWSLSTWILQKLDAGISQIKNLRHVTLYCSSDTPRQCQPTFKNIYKHISIHNIHMSSHPNKK